MPPPLTHTFVALGLDVEVAVDPQLPREIPDAVAALTGTYERSTRPARRRYQLCAAPLLLLRDGKPCAPAESPGDLLLQLELELLHDVAEAVPAGWFLHAGAVERAGRAIVLVGASGAGKSTVSCGLVARGAGYVSDELVLIGDDGVAGLARPIGFDAPFIGALPEGFSTYDRLAPWMEVRAPVVHPPPAALVRRLLPLGAMVLLRHSRVDAPSLRRVTSAEALPACWAETRRQDQDGLHRAIDVLSRVPAYELVTRTLEDSCLAIESIA